MKIVLIGAGSVGLTVVASAITAGVEVCIIARDRTAESLRKEGIYITGAFGEYRIASDQFIVQNVNANLPACDAIIVATKAGEVAGVLHKYVAALKAATKKPFILLLQNGWGSAQEAKQILPEGIALFCGRVQTGMERLTPTHIKVHVHGDTLRAGSLFDDNISELQKLIKLLHDGFFPFAFEADIEKVLLQKLLFNLCLNPLSALLKCTYGQLGQSKYTVEQMRLLADEAIKVITKARGIILYEDGADYIQSYLQPKLETSSAAHRSSMLQDIEAGRKTEITYISGAISKMGREYGIATPHNDMIVGLTLALESINDV